MQIELTGCTGAGKSSLARRLLRAQSSQRSILILGDDFVLGQFGLGGVRPRWARTLLIDAVALWTCALTWPIHHKFCRFAVRLILKTPAGWFEKLNLIRNVLKKIGVFEIIRRRSSAVQVVLVDEGTLHTAHNIFVHLAAQADPRDLLTFCQLVPLPEAVVYVRQFKSVLVERTLKRGHRRIATPSRANVERFVERAVEVFESLARQPRLAGRLFVRDEARQQLKGPEPENELLAQVLPVFGFDAGAPVSDYAAMSRLDLSLEGQHVASD